MPENFTITNFGPVRNPDGLDLTQGTRAWRALDRAWGDGWVPTMIKEWHDDQYEVQGRNVYTIKEEAKRG